MASIYTKTVKTVKTIKTKSLRINLSALVGDINNNIPANIPVNIRDNIRDNINNIISVDTHHEEKAEQKEEEETKNGYYYKNRDRKLEYQKKYNKEQGDKIKNYNKDYYQKRRQEILEKAKTKIICECGCEVQLFNMNSHKKTKKHLRALENTHITKSS